MNHFVDEKFSPLLFLTTFFSNQKRIDISINE